MLTLRTLTTSDLPLALRLKEQAGWNQTPQDLERFLALSGEGCFVAEVDGRGVGTVATFAFGPVGWIAMMLVDASFRGQGIGRALMNRVLDCLDQRDVASIRLDATPLGQPLYETLGFVPQFVLNRYAGVAQPPAAPLEMCVQPCGLESISDLNDIIVSDIIALDRAVTHTDRHALVKRLLAEHPQELRIARHEGRVTGYVTSRPGAGARQIGPCIGDSEAGPALLADALRRHAGETVFVDIPLDNTRATELAARHGLTVQRQLTRMCRGQAVLESLSQLWASSSPEKG